MYRKSARGWEKHLDFMILDQLSLQIAFLLAYMLRNGLSNPYSHLIYCNVAFILVVIDAGVLLLFESLKNVLKRGYYQEFAMTVKHVILVILVTTFYLFYIKRSEDYSRLALLYMTVLYLLVSYLTRILWKDQLKRKMRSSMKRSLLIITTKSMLDTVVYNIRNFNYEMFHVAGVAVIDCDMVGHDCGDSITVVANADTVADYVCREWVDEVFVNLPDDAPYPETLLNQLTEMGAVIHMKLAKTSNLIGEKKFVERLNLHSTDNQYQLCNSQAAFYETCFRYFRRTGRVPDHIDPYRDLRTVDLHTISRTDFLFPSPCGKKWKEIQNL